MVQEPQSKVSKTRKVGSGDVFKRKSSLIPQRQLRKDDAWKFSPVSSFFLFNSKKWKYTSFVTCSKKFKRGSTTRSQPPPSKRFYSPSAGSWNPSQHDTHIFSLITLHAWIVSTTISDIHPQAFHWRASFWLQLNSTWKRKRNVSLPWHTSIKVYLHYSQHIINKQQKGKYYFYFYTNCQNWS